VGAGRERQCRQAMLLRPVGRGVKQRLAESLAGMTGCIETRCAGWTFYPE